MAARCDGDPFADEIIADHLIAAFAAANQIETPYRHWLLTDCLPARDVDSVLELPFDAPSLDGVSGKRELHNATRRYFDVENRATFPCVENVSRAFQNPKVITSIEDRFGINLDGTYLRIEYAQDVNGFWLEPHTDIGVKAFTFLLYLSKDPRHANLGTDIYDTDKNWVGRSPFASNAGLIFVPSTITYHGFEARPIDGVRKSLVINYVTNERRAREQLAFPDQPIGS